MFSFNVKHLEYTCDEMCFINKIAIANWHLIGTFRVLSWSSVAAGEERSQGQTNRGSELVNGEQLKVQCVTGILSKVDFLFLYFLYFYFLCL